jgi:nicotinamide-nucleotide amidase
MDMYDLLPLAEYVGQRLKARRETLAIAESSSGGLLSAVLLAVPGASAYFLGGAVVYTAKARVLLMDLPREAVAGMRSASEPYALLLARTARQRFSATWGLAETGAAGPTGNPYGDAAGHSCIALSGEIEQSITLETAQSDRVINMRAFTKAALELLSKAIS